MYAPIPSRRCSGHPARAARSGHSRSKGEALLDLIGLGAVRNVAATELPMGAQKNLEVVRALMAGPRMLLLDEPAAGPVIENGRIVAQGSSSSMLASDDIAEKYLGVGANFGQGDAVRQAAVTERLRSILQST